MGYVLLSGFLFNMMLLFYSLLALQAVVISSHLVILLLFSKPNMIKKDWIDLPRYGEDYISGVRYFLDVAFTKGKVEGEKILCPCAICCNDSWEKRDVVFDHLISKGFVKGYKDWIYHGEEISHMDLDDDVDDIDGLLFETFKDVAKEGGVHEGLNEDAKKFYKLVEDANQELYPRCKKFSTLSFTI